MSCDKNRSMHALIVDKNIALTLLNTVANDMSPMVREVIIEKYSQYKLFNLLLIYY